MTSDRAAGHLAQIFRHPIKGHGREALASVDLVAGKCLPWDRHWAVAHEAAKLTSGWNPCANFTRGAKSPALMAITSSLDEATATVTLHHPDQGTFTFRPDDETALNSFLDWVRPLVPDTRAQPTRIVTADRGMTDTDFASISILSRSTLAELSARMDQDLSPDRWRGNLWIDGAAPWAEFDWIGRHIRIGGSVLRIEERITRCNATKVNPENGKPDADTLGALTAAYGHQDFGIYATVVNGGTVKQGDEWSVS